jgi:hypothetical protein
LQVWVVGHDTPANSKSFTDSDFHPDDAGPDAEPPTGQGGAG